MRLLMTGDTAGGVFTFVEELARALEPHGYEITLATFGPEPATRPRGMRWFHHCSKLEWQQPEPWSDLDSAGEWLEQLVKRENPDLLHFNTLCHGDLGWPVPLVTTVHSCVPTWWAAVKQTALPDEWNRYREVVERSLAAATMVTFPSRALSEAFRRAWNFKLPECRVIPNGIAGEEFFRRKKESFVLSAGRFWDEAKNIRALDRAAEMAEWPIYIAGDTNGQRKCISLGYLSPAQMKDWYARASIFVSAAIYEPFGLAILEAAAAGCALLLNDIPSLRENWSSAALFCRAADMGSQLNELIRNPDLRSQLQQQALDRSRCFNQANLAARYLELYQHARSSACVS